MFISRGPDAVDNSRKRNAKETKLHLYPGENQRTSQTLRGEKRREEDSLSAIKDKG